MDFNVDRLLAHMFIHKQWEAVTKRMIELDGYKETLERVMELAEEVNEKYYRTFKPPKFRINLKTDLTMTQIADSYGLKPFGKKMRICPFHKDIAPSLSLSDEKGVFNCFGCGSKGNIVKFLAMLKKVSKNGNI